MSVLMFSWPTGGAPPLFAMMEGGVEREVERGLCSIGRSGSGSGRSKSVVVGRRTAAEGFIRRSTSAESGNVQERLRSLYAEAPTPTNDIRPVASHDQLSYSDPVHTTATITSPVLLIFYSSSLVLVLILVCGSISCRLYAFSQTSEQSRDAISDGPVCSLETGKLRDRPLFQGGLMD